jgi:hypothetical protein
MSILDDNLDLSFNDLFKYVVKTIIKDSNIGFDVNDIIIPNILDIEHPILWKMYIKLEIKSEENKYIVVFRKEEPHWIEWDYFTTVYVTPPGQNMHLKQADLCMVLKCLEESELLIDKKYML